MKILFIGDIFGKGGRKAVQKLLPDIKKEYTPDIVIGNAENLAHGHGVTKKTLQEMTDAGIDFFTSGNHIWGNGAVTEILNEKSFPLLRPDNYPNAPGSGHMIVQVGKHKLLVINLMGRLFMTGGILDCPFRGLDAILENYKKEKLSGIFVDFHAETTAESCSFGFHADGKVSAVVGSHTHVPTADERILPKGTAYITDTGMVGGLNSSIGFDPACTVPDFITQLPKRHTIVETGQMIFNSVLIEIDTKTTHATSIKRIQKITEVN